MKSPRVELMVMAVLLALTMAGFWWMQTRHTRPSGPKPEVAIQDGKTIDFSTGQPVVKDDAKQKAALEKSLKEMEAAVQNVTFAPVAPGEKKKAEPPPAPPK
jgi:hypothetical protein